MPPTSDGENVRTVGCAVGPAIKSEWYAFVAQRKADKAHATRLVVDKVDSSIKRLYPYFIFKKP